MNKAVSKEFKIILSCVFATFFAIGVFIWNSGPSPGSHSSRGKNHCINNLRQIDGAKQQWALENHKDTNAIPTIADVAPYLKNNKFLVCPQGGKYTLGRVDEDPTCSIPGDVLPKP